ncbi:FAD synthase [uncultured archaeon]|nr:FAD synthase [uncultured archaeon]
MLEILRKLCAMEIREGGISDKSFSELSSQEKAKLEPRNGRHYLKAEERRKIRVGLAGGVFDVLHLGHVFMLSEAKKRCDVLAVVIASDAHIAKKGREPVYPQEYRTRMVDFLKPVDVAIAGGKDYTETLARVKPDVIIYGYDQPEFLKPSGVEIIKLHEHLEPEKLKSSKIIKELGL